VEAWRIEEVRKLLGAKPVKGEKDVFEVVLVHRVQLRRDDFGHPEFVLDQVNGQAQDALWAKNREVAGLMNCKTRAEWAARKQGVENGKA